MSTYGKPLHLVIPMGSTPFLNIRLLVLMKKLTSFLHIEDKFDQVKYTANAVKAVLSQTLDFLYLIFPTLSLCTYTLK